MSVDLACDAVLTALPGTIVGTNPAGAGSLILPSASANGKFLYSLKSAGRAGGMFAINLDCTLTNPGKVCGLPARSSLNGIAPN
jgi:6-phosphogluconolactonase